MWLYWSKNNNKFSVLFQNSYSFVFRPSSKPTCPLVQLCSMDLSAGWLISGRWSARLLSPVVWRREQSSYSDVWILAWLWLPGESLTFVWRRSTLTPSLINFYCSSNQKPRFNGDTEHLWCWSGLLELLQLLDWNFSSFSTVFVLLIV